MDELKLERLMKYCSECGSELIEKWITSEQRTRPVCGSCATISYENPRIIVCCIVSCRGKLLLCRRAHDPGRNKWMVPGGFLECGETLEAGAVRETFEETGIRIDPNDVVLYSIVNMTAIKQVLISFRVELDSEPILRPGLECLEAAFFSESAARKIEFAWRNTLGDDRFFEELRSGRFTIRLITLPTAQGTQLRWRGYQLEGSLPGSS
jgi:ADP-ribose pyrophosphatase YjhB (NUDIX family)